MYSISKYLQTQKKYKKAIQLPVKAGEHTHTHIVPIGKGTGNWAPAVQPAWKGAHPVF